MRMVRLLIRVFCFLLLLIAGVSSAALDVSSDDKSTPVLLSNLQIHDSVKVNRAGSRLLLSHSDRETEIAAKLDGTICLRRKLSQSEIWSFSSGSPIYQEYQAPGITGFFMSYGKDGQLYAHPSANNTMKLQTTIEEFIKPLPVVLENGEIILGSKRTTVYVVDAITGELLRIYGSSDSPSILQTDEKVNSLHDNDNLNKELVKSGPENNSQQQIHITRTDYTIQSFHSNSDNISWSMTVAEIGAILLCQDYDFPFITATLQSSYDLGCQIGSDFDMPFGCRTKNVVIRELDNLESISSANHDNPMLPLPVSGELALEANIERLRDHGMLPAAASGPLLPLLPDSDNSLSFSDNKEAVLYIPSVGTNESTTVRMPYDGVLSIFSERSVVLPFTLLIIIIMGFLVYRYVIVAKELAALKGQPSISGLNVTPSKKKKIRRSGRNGGSGERKDNHISSGNEDGFSSIEVEKKQLLNLNKLVDGSGDGRTIGKLIISNTEIAKGSNGTVVLEGFYEGRPVAVKRLVLAHHDVAVKEIQNLIASDRHPNIVRWYGVEHDLDFVYLALERCSCSMDDLVQIYSDDSQSQVFGKDQTSRAVTEYKVHLELVKVIMQDLVLWKDNGHPSPLLLKLMRDVVAGLAHLHELGIIHRDLKPQNVLIINEKYLCAKVSDMGISKRLLQDKSSLDLHATGCGSSGWQAPEQLLHGRQTRAVDMFSLGCVLFFCITGGRHPFGDRLERDINIVKNHMDLFLVECIPEAVDLISCLLNPDPDLRPNAMEVLQHPLFWNPETRLSFFRDASDRVELEDREAGSRILKGLESVAPLALGGKWDEKMEPAFITNIGRYRRYKYDSVRDLLRVMRNKLNHYRELPKEIQELVGPLPEGFDNYFASRYPKLFIEVYKVIYRYCREEGCFQKYFKGNVV
ncbi:hypothetical protein SLA2020_019590 [Shorea laevis]